MQDSTITGTSFKSVTTTWINISSNKGTTGMFAFVSGYNTSNGAQGAWILGARRSNSGLQTPVLADNNSGLTVEFQNDNGYLQMRTTSGTIMIACTDITH